MLSKYKTKPLEGHALVLGGSGGIGSEIVRALVGGGVSAVSFTYERNKDRAEALAKELGGAGVKTYFRKINQSDVVDVNKFLEEAVTAIGKEISIAVNTIGISPNKAFEEQALETTGPDIDEMGWRDVYEVNVFGCFVSTRAIAMRMRMKGIRGSITLITSTNGINSQSPISAHYDSSKAAQSHMMRIAAKEYAPHGIRINGIAPGWIDTRMNLTLPPEERQKEMERIWTGRFAEPEEIARFVAAIAGEAGSFLYGQDVMLDGGYT